jgi:hypothetical protein
LRDLEKLLPTINYAEPRLYFDFLNSYATELNEAGRKQEARNISRIVLASPFIQAYPEWQETARDLKEPARSIVTISPTLNLPHNVVPMPLVERVESQRTSYNPSAGITSFRHWKTKMAKTEKPPETLDTRQMILRIVSFFTDKATTTAQRCQIWEGIEKIMSQSNRPEPDDSEGA